MSRDQGSKPPNANGVNDTRTHIIEMLRDLKKKNMLSMYNQTRFGVSMNVSIGLLLLLCVGLYVCEVGCITHL